MKKRGKGKKMDQATENQVGLDHDAESLPRNQRRRTILQTETADNTSPRNRTRELEVGVVGRVRVLQTKAGRGIRSERPSSTGTGRGPWARVGAVRGRCEDHLTHLSSGLNTGLSGRPGSSFKLL
ncbi:hypothetical protein F2Q70_00014830 [Brassica cretica]|uniref:Uncharacterized protein n=1 Tax=Brassica cretica TaxID=69181 RepID=A0A8S9KNZ4_BRACR|nr:hypothetical protein F2Q70_00014830 [Brassica cretica]KAF2596089.1 hypothetical protein F2Q68_00007949 [Brassica cretica]